MAINVEHRLSAGPFSQAALLRGIMDRFYREQERADKYRMQAIANRHQAGMQGRSLSAQKEGQERGIEAQREGQERGITAQREGQERGIEAQREGQERGIEAADARAKRSDQKAEDRLYLQDEFAEDRLYLQEEMDERRRVDEQKRMEDLEVLRDGMALDREGRRAAAAEDLAEYQAKLAETRREEEFKLFKRKLSTKGQMEFERIGKQIQRVLADPSLKDYEKQAMVSKLKMKQAGLGEELLPKDDPPWVGTEKDEGAIWREDDGTLLTRKDGEPKVLQKAPSADDDPLAMLRKQRTESMVKMWNTVDPKQHDAIGKKINSYFDAMEEELLTGGVKPDRAPSSTPEELNQVVRMVGEKNLGLYMHVADGGLITDRQFRSAWMKLTDEEKRALMTSWKEKGINWRRE